MVILYSLTTMYVTVQECGQADAVFGASQTPGPHETLMYEQTVVYTCNSLYVRTHGNLERHCLANGLLNGTIPTCGEHGYIMFY